MLAYRFFVVFFVVLFSLQASAGTFDIKEYSQSRAYNGTTVFSLNTNPRKPKVVEVDMQGNVVWQYQIPSSFMNNNKSLLMDVERLENGNTLFNINQSGIYEINTNGDIVWQHKDADTSHDVDRLENGDTLYARGWVKKGEAHVVEVNSNGDIVWQWDGLSEFDVEPYADSRGEAGEWMHVNAVTRKANGNTLISIRNFHMVVEVNQDGKVVWQQTFKCKERSNRTGIFHNKSPKGCRQHEPELQDDGTMLIAVRAPHKIYRIDLEEGESVWGFDSRDVGIKSKTIRDVDQLPNGNVLIQDNNKLIEITSDGEVVWLLKVPGLHWKNRTPRSLYKAQRLPLKN